jgi:hypothetical protein
MLMRFAELEGARQHVAPLVNGKPVQRAMASSLGLLWDAIVTDNSVTFCLASATLRPTVKDFSPRNETLVHRIDFRRVSDARNVNVT